MRHIRRAGRLPTQVGLRFFVDAFMQVGNLSAEDRASIDRKVVREDHAKPVEALLTEEVLQRVLGSYSSPRSSSSCS